MRRSCASLQVPPLRGFTALQTLELSYNSISSLQPLSTFQSTNMEELYVANNAIQQIEVCVSAVGAYARVGAFLSQHAISQLMAYFQFNCWDGFHNLLGICMQAVQHLTNLRLLELGSNKIRLITGLEPLQKLQELWLGQNRIPQISGLDQ